jgi:predicted kinase
VLRSLVDNRELCLNVLQVDFNPTEYGRSAIDEASEQSIDDAWKQMKRANPRMYNGKLTISLPVAVRQLRQNLLE